MRENWYRGEKLGSESIKTRTSFTANDLVTVGFEVILSSKMKLKIMPADDFVL